MTSLPKIQYFLGANSPTGFTLFTLNSSSLERGPDYLYPKGRSGLWKIHPVRRVGARMEEEGLDTEYILCSGDPDSLDALLLPQLGVALVDGTAPHVVEPKYPGVVDRYVNMGDCYDKEGLAVRRQGDHVLYDGL